MISSKYSFYIDRAVLFIKKKAFEKLSGFDKGYFIFQGDVDLSRRVKPLGYKIFPGL